MDDFRLNTRKTENAETKRDFTMNASEIENCVRVCCMCMCVLCLRNKHSQTDDFRLNTSKIENCVRVCCMCIHVCSKQMT